MLRLQLQQSLLHLVAHLSHRLHSTRLLLWTILHEAQRAQCHKTFIPRPTRGTAGLARSHSSQTTVVLVAAAMIQASQERGEKNLPGVVIQSNRLPQAC